MCLTIKSTTQKLIAESDIVCYKRLHVLIYRDFNNTHIIKRTYLTPYQNFEIEIGKTYVSQLRRIFLIQSGGGYNYVINEGLHTYADKAFIIEWYGEPTFAAAECIIPKDSEYYMGDFNGRNSYASNTLKYIKLL